ncbi:lipopolysaccharide heptosyltransferase II [Campylobacter sp. 9BO]|uniref:lipopolysaccharide heptosyltransferase II n=1 Tax=Campylobacter sp. 9BO TaxID=3424759 RepID=UPI003D354F29
MKIFIEIPVWLGDAVMVTPAVQNIIKAYPHASLIILGSSVSNHVFKGYENIQRFIVNETKKSGNRYINLINLAKNIGEVDIAISFRRSFSSKFMMFFIKAKKKLQYCRLSKNETHLVVRYNDFINKFLGLNLNAKEQKLYHKPFFYEQKTLGINPGATYGSAKRWYPKEFADVAIALADKFDIVIFGGPSEIQIAADIQQILKQNNIKNYQNLAGKTSVDELISRVGGLNLFITNDSGPMHIAAAFQVPTVAIFGPTKFNETSPWMNQNAHIISKNLACAPCMKRTCPLSHHDCMRLITAKDLLNLVQNLGLF